MYNGRILTQELINDLLKEHKLETVKFICENGTPISEACFVAPKELHPALKDFIDFLFHIVLKLGNSSVYIAEPDNLDFKIRYDYQSANKS